ncbi:hypothetical protein OIU77_001919 [Salix suchowensis]|uniref:Uncharacterized protein n=1 Tax=Salix suchowensis TaxID=1278906 RepID=A0ABQ9B4D2_9ROSI|nr:hypothetical protein OIU77_001919 [Salix suchowensis]
MSDVSAAVIYLFNNECLFWLIYVVLVLYLVFSVIFCILQMFFN